MTNVSRNQLETKHKNQLIQQFAQLFARHSSASDVFQTFFTEAEQIMFVKRLAVILMLNDYYSQYRISKTLGVSESTVLRIREKFEEGDYDSLISIVNSRGFDSSKFWETIELLLRAGLPPRTGDRWKYVAGMNKRD